MHIANKDFINVYSDIVDPQKLHLMLQ
jgi:hypothetical protein